MAGKVAKEQKEYIATRQAKDYSKICSKPANLLTSTSFEIVLNRSREFQANV
jgi:hypothetical protein